MTRIWMVRHAPVAAQGICYGQSDVTTVVDDFFAAATLARQFHPGTSMFDELWCSPWERTRGIASTLGEQWRIPVRSDPRLSELSFGEWEGTAFTEIEARDGDRFNQWMQDYENTAPPGGEAATELVARVASWIGEVELSGKAVLAVAHGGTIRAARAVRRKVRYSAVVSEPVPFLAPERI